VAGYFNDFSLFTYLEYGVLDRLTLFGSVPFKHVSNSNDSNAGLPANASSGIGDINIGFKYGLLAQPWVVSVLSGVKLPAYRASNNENPSLGAAQVDGDLGLLVGRSLYPFPVYITGDVGYRLRAGQFANQVIYNFEAGVGIGPYVLFRGAINGINSQVNDLIVLSNTIKPTVDNNPNTGIRTF
jgi:hypothetical protein